MDTETGQQTTVANGDGAGALQTSGAEVGPTLARLGVQTVITGHVSPKVLREFRAAKFQVIVTSGGTLKGVVQWFLDGHFAVSAQGELQEHQRSKKGPYGPPTVAGILLKSCCEATTYLHSASIRPSWRHAPIGASHDFARPPWVTLTTVLLR